MVQVTPLRRTLASWRTLASSLIEADTINTFKSRLENSTRFGTKKLMLRNPTASSSSSRLLQECPSVRVYVYHTHELCLNSWTGSRCHLVMHKCTAVGLGQFNAILC